MKSTFLSRKRRTVLWPSSGSSSASRIRRAPRAPAYRRRTRVNFRARPTLPRGRNFFAKGPIQLIKHVKVPQLGPGTVSNTRVNYYARPSPQVIAIEKVGAANQWTNQYSFRVDNAYGFQDICSFNFCDPLRLAQLPQSIAIGGSSGIPPYRYVLDSVIGSISMANATTAPVELDVYDLVLKRDLPLALNIFQNGQNFTAGNAPYPDVIWKYFIAMNNGLPSTTPIGNSAAKNIGASPFDCTVFKEYFKVVKRSHVMLSQGGVHRHQVVQRPNRLLDSTLFNQQNPLAPDINRSLGGIQGLTTYVMVVQRGFPVSDAESAPTVTTSLGSVCYVQEYRYKYTWVADNIYFTYNGDSLTSPTSAQVINVGSGAAEPVLVTV